MNRNVYSYVNQVNGLWNAICISAVGNLYCNKTFTNQKDAEQEVYQNIKGLLNNKHIGENWYNLIHTTIDSNEIKLAWEDHYEFSNPSWKDKLKYKSQIFYLKCCIWGKWIFSR